MQLAPNQIQLPEPSRDVMRLIFSLAIAATATDTAKQTVAAAAGWYELKWQSQDTLAKQQQQQAARQAAADALAQATADALAAAQQQQEPSSDPPAPDAPRQLSAVEQHGHDSPEAKAVRSARAAARAEAKAALGHSATGKD